MARIKKDLDAQIRRQAKNRCGYCLNPQELLPYKLEIEHLSPKSAGGASTEENLWLACRECNAHKAAKTEAVDNLTEKTVKLFNPRTQNWNEHFDFAQDKTEIVDTMRIYNIKNLPPSRLNISNGVRILSCKTKRHLIFSSYKSE